MEPTLRNYVSPQRLTYVELDPTTHTVQAVHNGLVVYKELVPYFATGLLDDVCNSARTRAYAALGYWG